MKVLMVCSGGFSSAIVVESIKKEAIKQNMELEIKAVGATEFGEELNAGQYDLAIVAPQVRHMVKTFVEKASELGVPVELIEPTGYTPIGGAKVLQQIKKYEK